jgi:hypothetical protein
VPVAANTPSSVTPTLQGSANFGAVLAQNPVQTQVMYDTNSPDLGNLASQWYVKNVTTQPGYADQTIPQKIGVFNSFLNKYQIDPNHIPNFMDAAAPATNPVDAAFHGVNHALADFNTVADTVVQPFKQYYTFGLSQPNVQPLTSGADSWALNLQKPSNPINVAGQGLGQGLGMINPIKGIEGVAENALPGLYSGATNLGGRMVQGALKGATGFGGYLGLTNPINTAMQGGNLQQVGQSALQGLGEGIGGGALFGAGGELLGTALQNGLGMLTKDNSAPIGMNGFAQREPGYYQQQPVDDAQRQFLANYQRSKQKQLMHTINQGLQESQAAKGKTLQSNPVYQMQARRVANELHNLSINIRTGIQSERIPANLVSDNEITQLSAKISRYWNPDTPLRKGDITRDQKFVTELQEKIKARLDRHLKNQSKMTLQGNVEKTVEDSIEQPKESATVATPAPPEEKPATLEGKTEKDQIVQKLDEEHKQYTARQLELVQKKIIDPQQADKNIKGSAMKTAAEKRKVIQGDSLETVPGGLTGKELTAKIERLKSNYIGKPVIVDGQNAKVVSNPFGKVKVQFADGSTKTVEAKEVVEPLKATASKTAPPEPPKPAPAQTEENHPRITDEAGIIKKLQDAVVHNDNLRRSGQSWIGNAKTVDYGYNAERSGEGTKSQHYHKSGYIPYEMWESKSKPGEVNMRVIDENGHATTHIINGTDSKIDYIQDSEKPARYSHFDDPHDVTKAGTPRFKVVDEKGNIVEQNKQSGAKTSENRDTLQQLEGMKDNIHKIINTTKDSKVEDIMNARQAIQDYMKGASKMNLEDFKAAHEDLTQDEINKLGKPFDCGK